MQAKSKIQKQSFPPKINLRELVKLAKAKQRLSLILAEEPFYSTISQF